MEQQQQWQDRDLLPAAKTRGHPATGARQPAIPAAACDAAAVGRGLLPDQQAISGQAAAREESGAALHKQLLTVDQHGASRRRVCR